MQKSIFFSIVGLCIASAAALQLWLYSRLDGVCEDQMLGFAPSVAGGVFGGVICYQHVMVVGQTKAVVSG